MENDPQRSIPDALTGALTGVRGADLDAVLALTIPLRAALRAAGYSRSDDDARAVMESACRFVDDYNRASPVRQEEHRQFLALNQAMNEIALFLRHHYAVEISSGHHNGLTTSSVVIRYLAIERSLHRWLKRRVILTPGRGVFLRACSCSCGGSFAWMESGGDSMADSLIGCICHHVLVSDASEPSGISVFEVPHVHTAG